MIHGAFSSFGCLEGAHFIKEDAALPDMSRAAKPDAKRFGLTANSKSKTSVILEEIGHLCGRTLEEEQTLRERQLLHPVPA